MIVRIAYVEVVEVVLLKRNAIKKFCYLRLRFNAMLSPFNLVAINGDVNEPLSTLLLLGDSTVHFIQLISILAAGRLAANLLDFTDSNDARLQLGLYEYSVSVSEQHDRLQVKRRTNSSDKLSSCPCVALDKK